MGNLVRKPAQILKNSIVSGDVVYSESAGDPMIFPDYNKIESGTIVKFSKSIESAGVKHSIAVHPDIAYPSDTSQFEWYVSISGKSDFLQGKASELYLIGKTYQGAIGALAAENSGKIADADYIRLIDAIVLAINGDKGALVTARRSGKVLMLTAKSADISFEVRLDSKYGTKSGAALTFTDGITDSTGNDLDSAGLAAALNSLTGLAFIDDFFNTGYNLVITGNATDIGSQDITDYTASGGTLVVASITAIETSVEFYIEGISDIYPASNGYLSQLTLNHVQRIFPYQSMKAGYPADAFPSPSVADWARYYFKIKHVNAYSLDGANHIDSFIEEFEFYVPLADAIASSGANWDDLILEFLTDSSYVDPHGGSTPWGLAGSV